MRKLDFTLNIVPPTASHHQKKIVRIGHFHTLADNYRLNAAKDLLTAALLPHQPEEPFTGPVELTVVWVFPLRKSDRGRANRHASRPDLSNLLKTLEDRLVALRFITDDGLITRVVATKDRGLLPRIEITITEVN